MRKFGFFSVLLIFLISALSCQISGGPKPPRLLTISQAEAKSFENAINNSQVNAQTGMFTIKVSESQVSSYFTYQMTDDLSKFLHNPQVYFEPDQVHIYGTYMGEVIQVDGLIILTATVVENQPKFNIVAVEFGPIPLPGAITKTLTEQLDKEVTKALTKNTTQYQIEAISINTGELSFTMKKK